MPSRADISKRSEAMTANKIRRPTHACVPHPRAGTGFTLVELLTVVAIIMILAGLTVGGLSYFNRKVAEDKTRMQLKLLANGLEAYYFDFGEYPEATTDEGNENSNSGSNALYMALFYDTDDDGENYKDDDEQDIYVPDLDPASNNQGWISGTGANVKLIDGFANEYKYRKVDDASLMKNPDYDLWSVGPDGRTDETDKDSEDNRDDIWDR
jgi:type II secretory pathway pseudopilin PulG